MRHERVIQFSTLLFTRQFLFLGDWSVQSQATGGWGEIDDSIDFTNDLHTSRNGVPREC